MEMEVVLLDNEILITWFEKGQGRLEINIPSCMFIFDSEVFNKGCLPFTMTQLSAWKFLTSRSICQYRMALGGGGPQRGSAAATASMRRRRTTSSGTSGGAAGTMLQFYTDDAPGLKISPNVVLVMSIGFIAFVAVLHVMGKLYFVRREA